MALLLLALGATALVAPLFGRLPPRGRKLAGALLAVVPITGFLQLLGQVVFDPAHLDERLRVPWVKALGVDFALRVDGLSAFFALLILGIGALILVYAGSYLKEHRDLGRFYALLLAFMASMLGLVLADDAILMFVFWEGTSLTSYLLIGFDHEDEAARVSARKALIVTGTGGLALLGGLIVLHQITGTWAISEWTELRATILSHPLGGLAFALVLLGAFTKSAQVPFHFWLPAAMAGPTPVSAYLHSATMVKAGVFLLARLSPIWSGTPGWIYTLAAFGGATMLLSAWASLRFRDMKQVLAYTTTMALGLLVMLLGLGDEGSVKAAMAYLLVHALYKGSLFMMAGTVDHGTGTRDLEALSGLRRKLPFSALAAGLAAASMAGLPPFVGFVGKELWYEANLHFHGPLGLAVLGVSILANAALFGVAGVLAIGPFFGPLKVSGSGHGHHGPHPEENEPSTSGRPGHPGRLEHEPGPGAHAHEGDDFLLAGPLILAVLGLAFGLAPGLLDGLIGAAASAVRAETIHPHLALWHGLNPALLASIVTFLLGAFVYRAAASLRRGVGFREAVNVFAEAPARLFELFYLGLGQAAAAFSRAVYVGRLRRYVMTTLLVTLIASLWILPGVPGLGLPSLGALRPHEAALIVILVVSSGIATFAEPAMRAIIAVGISGYCVALIYLLFGAPDVAMTQFAIETLTVILVVLTLLHLPGAAYLKSGRRAVARDFAVALGVGGVLATILLGVLAGPLPQEISEWYLMHSVPDAHGHNVVNVILVDFRGFDTWGEITVLTIAGLGVYALLRRRARWGFNGAVSRGPRGPHGPEGPC